MTKTRTRKGFVVCLDNHGYSASLEPLKIYRVLADAGAAEHGLLRVIDESGEDYLYPEERFAHIEVPKVVERALRHAS